MLHCGVLSGLAVIGCVHFPSSAMLADTRRSNIHSPGRFDDPDLSYNREVVAIASPEAPL
jgi:hypothetical protein